MPASATLDSSAAATWVRVREMSAPALLFDIEASTLIDANAAGVAVCFRGRRPGAWPLSLDRAMPAWVVLRAARAQLQEVHAPLCIWTQAGAVMCDGHVTPLGEGRYACVTLAAPCSASSDVVLPSATNAAAARHARNAKLAHELRTPIGAVAAYAEVLAGQHFGPLGNDRYREYAQNMRDGALHALAVIEGMIGLSREESGARRELRFRDVDPGDVARNCLAVIRPIAEAADVRLEISVPGNLPRIIADEVALRQMLLNLLTNAVKFARPSDRVTLGVTYDAEGTLTFAVDDTGPGLAATRRPDAPSGTGLGLGLPLTRELAEANGAALAIESEPGLGTRARISFSHTRVVV